MTIQILPPRLANQIAAGEVVERPASVIKELVENSLDAGATQLEVTVEQGGHKRLLIRDNGAGIAKEELALALSRHATSKVSHLDDIESIATLGFRGEALASISSVARLTLTSKPAEQSEAWLAYAEGREMEVQIKPAAHPNGTSVEVADLFFNTPARRKFLRAEKTEFHHIDELIKRLAMARFDVGFRLTHNGKVVRNLPACQQDTAKLRRIGTICGQLFAREAVHLSAESGTLKLEGWALPAQHCTQQSPAQYTFINGRMIRDKVVTHAIRQAYAELMAEPALSAYALYLTLPFTDVDVNVHPAKHEVRFSQARLVHDFVVQAVQQALHTQPELTSCGDSLAVDPETGEILTAQPEPDTSNHSGLKSLQPLRESLQRVGESPQPDRSPQRVEESPQRTEKSPQPFNEPPAMAKEPSYSANYPNQRGGSRYQESAAKSPTKAQWQSYHALMSPVPNSVPSTQEQVLSEHAEKPTLPYQWVEPNHAVIFKDNRVWLLDLNAAELALLGELYPTPWKGQPLLLPLSVPIEKGQAQSWQQLIPDAKLFGIQINLLGESKLIIKSLPALLRNADLVNQLDALQQALLDKQPQQLLALRDCNKAKISQQTVAQILAALPALPTPWFKELSAAQLVSLFNQ